MTIDKITISIDDGGVNDDDGLERLAQIADDIMGRIENYVETLIGGDSGVDVPDDLIVSIDRAGRPHGGRPAGADRDRLPVVETVATTAGAIRAGDRVIIGVSSVGRGVADVDVADVWVVDRLEVVDADHVRVYWRGRASTVWALDVALVRFADRHGEVEECDGRDPYPETSPA